jgi:hypothetical protein
VIEGVASALVLADDPRIVIELPVGALLSGTGVRGALSDQLVITAPGYLRSETRFPLRPSQYLDTEARLTPAVRDTSGRSRPGDRPVARTVHEPITEQPVAVSTTVATKPETFAAVPANTNTSVLHGRVIDIEDGAATRDCTAVRSPIRTSGRAR